MPHFELKKEMNMQTKIIILALFLANLSALIFTSCAIIENVFPPKMNVLVWEDLENGQYHVVGLKDKDQYSDVIKLPPGTQEGDVVKIKIKKDER